MPLKRRQSLQALFIPPFLLSSATSRSRSHSDTGQSQPIPINSPPTTPTRTTTISQHSPQLDPFSQALYSFSVTDNVASLESSYNDLLDTDPFANLSTPSSPPHSPTHQGKPLPLLPSLGTVLSAAAIPRSPLSPAQRRAQPHTTTGIKYTSVTTPSSPVSGPFQLPTSPVRPAYTKPVFKSTPSLPSLRSLSQGQYIRTRKIRKGCVGATLPIEPWNTVEAPDPVLEESWLSSLGDSCPPDHSSPRDRTDDITIYSGGFNGSTEDLVSTANPSVQQQEDYGMSASLSRQPSDRSLAPPWDDGLSSLSSFTETESDFHSPTWSSFSRRSSGHGNTSSSFEDSRPYSLVGALDSLHSGADLSRSNSYSSISLSDEDLDLPPASGGGQMPTPLVLSASVDFHPGTSAETIRPSPSQLMGLRLSERSSPGHSIQGSSSSSRSSSLSPSNSRPITPDPSETSHLSTEGSDEDSIPHDRDSEPEDSSVDNGEDDHQDGSEVETVCDHHGPLFGSPGADDVKGDLSSPGSEQPEDGEGSSGHNGGGRYTNTSTNAYGNGNLGVQSSGFRGSSGGASGSGNGRDGNGRRPSRPSMPLHETEEEEETDATDDYGEEENPASPNQSAAPGKKQSSDEDNVPLARSIPTALKAQKSIRKQVKEETTQRRQERAMRIQAKIRNVSGGPHSAGPATSSFQQEQTSPPRVLSRTRTSPPPASSRRHPFAIDDLTKKLMDVQTSITGSNNQEPHRSGTRTFHQHNQEPGPSKSRRPSQEVPQSPPPAPSYPTHDTSQKPALRPTRSFHRPTRSQHAHDPLPILQSVSAGATPSQPPRRPQTGDPTANQPSIFPNFPLRRSKSTKLQPQARPADGDHGSQGRPSSSRPSAEISVDSRAHWSEKAAALPPVPPVPTYEALKQKSGEVWQQKVFVGDMQRSTLVEVGATTTAQDVIDAIANRSEMGTHDAKNNWGKGWMLFEIAQDFGMERPIRNFEVMADVRASWNQEKTVTSLLLKRTSLSARLSVEALPSTPPRYQGYLEYEVKRGKWSKRWMELRENSLWLSKRDNGKDEVFLCKLSNFDVYSVTRVMKTPKPFVFAVKSTDNLSLFENTADYLHTFCCKEKEGLEWMLNILLARSYIYYQGRVQQPKPPGASLSRAGTRRGPSKPAQPLVSLPPPPTVQTTPAKAVFEPGSLLATRMM